MAVGFRLLGDVEAHIDGRPVEIGHARQRCVLLALLLDANRTVPTDQVIDRVWADRVPQRARATLSGYLSRLRQVLAPAEDVRIVRQPGGYLLSVDPAALDVHVFHQLVSGARASQDQGAAVAQYERALGLWRGAAFGILDTPWLNSVRADLDAARSAAELDRNDAALAAGRHAALLGDLTAGAAAHPLDERRAGQLMLCLYRCGRQAEALEHFQRVWVRLAEELGADPSPPLQLVHRRIRTGDAVAAGPSAGSAPEVDRGPVPRQLPAPAPAFVGRTTEIAELDALLAVNDQPATVVVAAVAGTAGVGKTALAVHWAHRVADRFADGQLYVNLRGFAPDRPAMAPAEALRGFLDALHVPAERMPTALEQQAALFRSTLAGRRMLVLLDNARDADQVRPLLPGSPGCVIVVTSRNELPGLVAIGAHPVTLDLFTPAEAGQLLGLRLGADRVAAEPRAVDDMIKRCAGLPLALAIVAARAATRPRLPLAALADELRHAPPGLDALDGGDAATDVRAVFSWSYRRLSPAAARMFRLLGEHPGPDASRPAATSTAGVSPRQASALLAELTRAHLVTEHVPGRFAMHDLLRAYAAELARSVDSTAARRAASGRAFGHYLHSADAADRLLYPSRDRITMIGQLPDVTPETMVDRQQALAWFTAEHEVLRAAVQQATTHGFETHAWQLAWMLWIYLNLQGHLADQIAVQRLALDAAGRVGDQHGQAHAHRHLGRTHDVLGHDDEAAHHLRRALDLFERLDDRINQAQTHTNLARMLARQRQYVRARDHDLHSLHLYRAAGHLAGQARVLNNLGSDHAKRGEHDQAIVYCQEAVARNHEIGNQHGEATAWDSLGWSQHQVGRYQEADASYRSALALFREARDRYTEADTLAHLADTRRALGDPAGARELWQRALDVFEQVDHAAAERVRARLRDLGDHRAQEYAGHAAGPP